MKRANKMGVQFALLIASIILGVLSSGDAKGKTKSKFKSQELQYHHDLVLHNYSALLDYFSRDRNNGKWSVWDKWKNLPTLRQELTMQIGTGLCDRSLCPWIVGWHYDEERVPQSIPYAKCQTRDCNFSFAKLGGLASLKLELDTSCEAVKKDIFSMKNGRIHWVKNVPIACICTKNWSHGQLSKQFVSDRRRTQQEMTSHIEVDVNLQNVDSKIEGNHKEQNPLFCTGAEDPSLTDAQRERLKRQETLKKQNSESFEEMMKRKRGKKFKTL